MGATEYCGGGAAQKSAFARFSVSFDFRLLQHYPLRTGHRQAIAACKSFWGDDENSSGPLMRFVCGDVRDHVVSPKIDHGPS